METSLSSWVPLYQVAQNCFGHRRGSNIVRCVWLHFGLTFKKLPQREDDSFSVDSPFEIFYPTAALWRNMRGDPSTTAYVSWNLAPCEDKSWSHQPTWTLLVFTALPSEWQYLGSLNCPTQKLHNPKEGPFHHLKRKSVQSWGVMSLRFQQRPMFSNLRCWLPSIFQCSVPTAWRCLRKIVILTKNQNTAPKPWGTVSLVVVVRRTNMSTITSGGGLSHNLVHFAEFLPHALTLQAELNWWDDPSHSANNSMHTEFWTWLFSFWQKVLNHSHNHSLPSLIFTQLFVQEKTETAPPVRGVLSLFKVSTILSFAEHVIFF